MILFGGLAAVFLFAAIVVYVFYSKVNDSTVDRFAKVSDGMTLGQVIKVMGRDPSFDQQEPDGSIIYGWSYLESTSAVTVQTRDGVSMYKKPSGAMGPRPRYDMTPPWQHNVRNK